MLLEAEPDGCFSSTFVLKFDGRAVGKFEGRFFSEGLDLALVGRRRLRFEKVGWIGSHFRLLAEGDEKPLGEADRSGVFSSSWDLSLSVGPAQMVREGWFATGYAVQRGDEALGRVDRSGLCGRGFYAEGRGLKEEDLILVGLVYHTVLRRQAQQAAAAGHAGS